MVSSRLRVVLVALVTLSALGCSGAHAARSNTGPHVSGANGARPLTSVPSLDPVLSPKRTAGQPVISSLTADALEPAILVHPGGYYVRGIDRVDSRLLVMGQSPGDLRQSSDWGATWSVAKGLPSGVAPGDVNKIVRFRRYLYLLASGRSPGVWRTAPAPGNARFVWSRQLLKLTRGSTAIMTDLDASSWGTNDYLFAGEYGDPVGGPSIWRISAQDADGKGTHWTRSYGPDPQDRHIHAVAADPYVRGDVWATIGDGGPTTLAFSNDYGATWVRVIESYSWQAVQISFDAKFVYLAGDQPAFSYAVLDRATFMPAVATPNRPADLQIPLRHAPGDFYYAIAYFGAVDPATGVYYCVSNDQSSAGDWMGLFFARRAGERIRILDPGGRDNSMNGEVFIAHGTVYTGVWQHALLPAT